MTTKTSDLLAIGWILFLIAMLMEFLQKQNSFAKLTGIIGIIIIGIVEIYYLYEKYLKGGKK